MAGRAQKLLLGLLGGNLGLTGYHLYTTRALHTSLYEEMEARMDELEGTQRGHIGLIEDSLERIELRQAGREKEIKGGWGQGLSAKADKEYQKRGKDERGK